MEFSLMKKRFRLTSCIKPIGISPAFLPGLLLVMLIGGGCSSFNCTRLENILGANTNLISFSYRIADQLIERAMPPLVPLNPDMPVLVTTPVDNNDLSRTSRFGRVLQEHITSRLVQRGYTVREVKLADSLTIEPKSGETILSRNLSRLLDDQPAQAILVGTVSRSNRILYISMRLINPVNNNIFATDDYRLCMDDDILNMFGLKRQGDLDDPVDEPGQPLLNSVL
jgi:TolB-like protein